MSTFKNFAWRYKISLLILFLIMGCSENKNSNFPEEELIKIYAKKEGYPTVQPFEMVIPLEDKWIVYNNIHVYQFIYIPWNKNQEISYLNFLRKIFSKEIKLNFTNIKEQGYHVVSSNQKVIIEYNANNFDYIKKKYLKEENGKLILNVDLPSEDYYGLIKVMFFNGFLVMFDDYEGKLIFKSLG